MEFDKDFINQQLTELDFYFSDQGIPVAQRHSKAIGELSAKSPMSLPLSKPDPLLPNPADIHWPVTQHIINWFDYRYGQENNLDWGPGRCVFYLRGSCWHFHFPKMYDPYYFVVGGVDVNNHASANLAFTSQFNKFDILDAIKKFPDELRQSLSATEKLSLFTVFQFANSALILLSQKKGDALIRAALANIDDAVSLLTASEPETVLARLAVLKAAEKVMLYAIKKRGGQFNKDRDLTRMQRHLQQLGAAPDISSEIKSITRNVGRSYGQSKSVDPIGAIEAHHAFLLLVNKVMPLL